MKGGPAALATLLARRPDSSGPSPMSVTFTPAQAFAWNGGATATARRPPIITVRRPPGYVEDVGGVEGVEEHAETARKRERGRGRGRRPRRKRKPGASRREGLPSPKVRALLLARLEAAEASGALRLAPEVRSALLAALAAEGKPEKPVAAGKRVTR
jgi:hypothetical protein